LAPAGWLRSGAFFRVCDAEKLQKSPRALKSCISKICVLRLSLLNYGNLKIMNLNQFAQMRGFQQSHQTTGAFIVDHALNGEQGDEMRETLKLKRIQFDTVPQLYDQLESVCSLLECSKREFLEMAVYEAIDRAQIVFMDSYKAASGRDFMDDFGVKGGV
jgi:hypothetical protein